MWGNLSDAQQNAWLAVMQATLSTEGYNRVLAEWNADDALAAQANAGAPRWAARRNHARQYGQTPPTGGPVGAAAVFFGKQYYWVALIGTPSETDPWQWQWGGHHVTVNATIVGPNISLTPSFIGVQPATYTDASGKTVRPLGDIEDEAFALVNRWTPHSRRRQCWATRRSIWCSAPVRTARPSSPKGYPLADEREPAGGAAETDRPLHRPGQRRNRGGTHGGGHVRAESDLLRLVRPDDQGQRGLLPRHRPDGRDRVLATGRRGHRDGLGGAVRPTTSTASIATRPTITGRSTRQVNTPREHRDAAVCGERFLLGLLTLLAWLALPQTASAHPLDVYLQATYITVAPARIVVELDLSPGVLVAPQVLPQLDTDGDQQIADAESQAYVDTILRDVVLQVDGQPLALAVTKIDMPAVPDHPGRLRHDPRLHVRHAAGWHDGHAPHHLREQQRAHRRVLSGQRLCGQGRPDHAGQAEPRQHPAAHDVDYAIGGVCDSKAPVTTAATVAYRQDRRDDRYGERDSRRVAAHRGKRSDC